MEYEYSINKHTKVSQQAHVISTSPHYRQNEYLGYCQKVPFRQSY